MSVHGVAVGNSFPHVTILREPNVSNAITVVYSSPPTNSLTRDHKVFKLLFSFVLSLGVS